MDDIDNPVRQDARAFLSRHKAGVLGTVSADGGSHSRLLYFVSDDNFNIYFCTLSTTRKFADISANSRASFTVATEDIPQTLQLEGTVSTLTEGERAIEGMALILDTLMSNSTFYWPVLKLSPGEVVIMKLKPTWIRWADYAFGDSGGEQVLHEISIVP